MTMKTGDGIPVVLNSHAGSLHEPVGAEQLRRMAREVGFEIRIIQTHSTEEMQSEIEELVARRVPRLGVAGGDGTVEAAIQKAAGGETAIGILSQGTFNNFATCLRLPHNLPASLSVLHTGKVVEVDLGRVEGHGYFTESAGMGLFADGLALYGQGKGKKNVLRGLVTLVRLSLSCNPRTLRLIIDGEAAQSNVVLCEVANTYRIAQAVPIAPYASLDDGMLDVVVFGAIPRHELPAYFRAVRAQMHVDLPKVKMIRARREVRLETPHPRNVHADDQIVAKTPVTITVAPRALKVITPDVP